MGGQKMGKIILLLLAIAALTSSCTGEPIPEELSNNIRLKQKNLYFIEWQSTEVNPSMKFNLYRGGEQIIKDSIVKEHKFYVKMLPGDGVSIAVNYEAPTANPKCYIAISKYNNLNYYDGYYDINSLELIYERESNTNAMGFSGFINKDGRIDD